MDKQRDLYLIAYDICEPRRLRHVYRYLAGYKVAGQKSVCEVWVTPAELKHIRSDLEAMMEMGEDRLHILALEPRMKPLLVGRATHFTSNHFAIV